MGRKTGLLLKGQCWLVKVISEYHVFFCVLQVIRNDALTFGSQQTRGFVLTFRRFFKGDDDNYVMIFRCK